MKVWIVTQVNLFALGRSGNKIIAVYSNEKAANRHASSNTFLIAQPFKVRKKHLKPKMMGLPLGPVIIDELHGEEASKRLWDSTSPSRTLTRTAEHKSSGTRASTATSS